MENPKIELVIFDCDGVLIDSEILANRVAAEIKTEFGEEDDELKPEDINALEA